MLYFCSGNPICTGAESIVCLSVEWSIMRRILEERLLPFVMSASGKDDSVLKELVRVDPTSLHFSLLQFLLPFLPYSFIPFLPPSLPVSFLHPFFTSFFPFLQLPFLPSFLLPHLAPSSFSFILFPTSLSLDAFDFLY